MPLMESNWESLLGDHIFQLDSEKHLMVILPLICHKLTIVWLVVRIIYSANYAVVFLILDGELKLKRKKVIRWYVLVIWYLVGDVGTIMMINFKSIILIGLRTW